MRLRPARCRLWRRGRGSSTMALVVKAFDPMFLSYAQRLEDYHLALAFAGQETGVYIDVGAGHPVADNVTYALYLQGWSGLVIEPQGQLIGLYDRLRPRDRAVKCLAGRTSGEVAFHLFDTLHGLSTICSDRARAGVRHAGRYRTVQQPMATLASLCEAQGIGSVDLLKIDVEGAEQDVLEGADFDRWRPRLVVAEVLSPGSDAIEPPDWENLLLSRDYRLALFDGVNRFYVAREETEIAERLPREPAPWDAVEHLYAFGRAPENPGHPDHPLACRLLTAFLAGLPTLTDSEVRRWLGEDAGGHVSTEAFRAALGRIAAPYDGGLLLDDPPAPART